MKKILLTLLTFSFLFQACDNELDLVADWKDIPVVWGMLNPEDDIHLIRVEKAFLDGTSSALDIAQVSDSLYYDNAIVQLQKVESGETFDLARLDAAALGIEREEGIFATDPNYVYGISANEIDLVAGDEVMLKITRSEDLPVVEASTIVLDEMSKTTSLGDKLSFSYNSETSVLFKADFNAVLFDMYADVRVKELNQTTNVLKDTTYTWLMGRNVSRENLDFVAVRVSVLGVDFFNFLSGNIEADDNILRQFVAIDLQVTGVGQELGRFIEISNANTGLTSSQEIPTYTSRTSLCLVKKALNHQI